MHFAVEGDDFNIVKYLIEKGADVNIKDYDGWIPLHWVTLYGSLDAMKYLIDEGMADFNVQDNDGWNAIHWAASEGKLDIIKYLVEEKRVDCISAILHMAKENGNMNIVQYLTENIRLMENA